MAFAFIENNSISRYPIGSAEIKRKFPNTSFTVPLEGQNLSDFGVVEVHATPQPTIDRKAERLEEGTPILKQGTWIQSWNIVPLSTEEKQRVKDNTAFSVRADRNKRLADCDWTQLADSPLDADAKLAWQLYRETLRMVPEQAGFPWDIEWPPVPGS